MSRTYLLSTPASEGEQVRVEESRHTTGLFPTQASLSLIAKAGFAVETWPYTVHEDGREARQLVAAAK